jgi:hypothetical protein
MNIHNIIEGVGFDKDCSDVAGSCDTSSQPPSKAMVNRQPLFSIAPTPLARLQSTAIQCHFFQSKSLSYLVVTWNDSLDFFCCMFSCACWLEKEALQPSEILRSTERSLRISHSQTSIQCTCEHIQTSIPGFCCVSMGSVGRLLVM